jgi:hypothetical protein
VKLFLSYRRGDAGGHAGRLGDALRLQLGERGVFQDVTAIAPGEDFTVAIDAALDESDAVLVVIGRGWLRAATEDGRPRLFEPGDYVRLELARALERGASVVPVLVNRARLPAASELPADLAPLALRQAVVLHDETWHQDVAGLLRSLRGESDVPAPGRRRRLLVAAAAGIAVLAIAAWVLAAGADDPPAEGDDTSVRTDGCPAPEGDEWRQLDLSADPTVRVTEDPAGDVQLGVREAYAREQGEGWQLVLWTTYDNTTEEPLYNGDWHYPSVIVGRRQFDQTCYRQERDVVDAGTIGDAVAGYEIGCEPTGHIELVTSGDRIDVTDPALGPGDC